MSEEQLSDIGVDGPQTDPDGQNTALGPNQPVIENARWWGVLTPTAQGKFAWLTLGSEQPVLYSTSDKARASADGIQGAMVYPVVVGISGPNV